MPQRLILHVGRHKTGTSAIQHYCRNADDQFAGLGVIYPAAGRKRANGRFMPAHHQLAEGCNPDLADKKPLKAIKRDFFDEIEGYDTIVVSSEGFQNIRDFTLLESFFDNFEQFDVTVVCYLREYVSYLVSGFRQMVQNQARFVTFANYCRRTWRIGEFLEDWSHYGELVTRPFERNRLKNGDVVDDFLALFGVERQGDKNRIVNHSIGGNLLLFRLVENYLSLDPTPYLEAEALAIDHAPFRRAFYLPDEAAAKIRAASNYNEIVCDRVGPLTLASYADEPKVPVVESIDSDLARVYSGDHLDEMRSHLARLIDETAGWFEYRAPAKRNNLKKARQAS